MCTQFLLIWKKTIKKKFTILHECHESRNANRLLRVDSTQLEFDKEDREEKSTMNPIYKYDIENELQQNIHDIKK
jgi:hypothetical protein